MAIINIPEALEKFRQQEELLNFDALKLGDLFRQLELHHPKLTSAILDKDCNPKEFVAIFVDGMNIEEGCGMETNLGKNSEVDIMLALAGG